MTDRWSDSLSLLCRWIVGVVFLYACIDKLAHPVAFAQNIANYRLLPMPLLHPFAWLLPVLEAVVALALLAGWQRRGAGFLAAGMSAMFIGAIGISLVRGLDISCGCFQTDSGHSVGLDLMLRDLGLLAASLVPMVAPTDRWSLDGRRCREH